MNILESYTTTSPFEKTEECAKFVVDDVTTPFVLHGVTTANQKYTFSFWVMSDTEGVISTCDCEQETSVTWAKFKNTFTATATDLAIAFDMVGTYYIYHPQLELGSVATDWTPSPEDMDQAIADSESAVRQTITEQTTSIISTCEQLILAASEKYVGVDEYRERNAELDLQADEVALKFTGVDEQIASVNDELKSTKTEIYKHFSFSDNGLVISAGENQMSIRIDNDVIVFEKNGIQFGWWDGIDFHTGNIAIEVTERAQFGNFAFVPRSDGSLSFLKVEHNSGFYVSVSGGTMAIYGAYPSLDGTTLDLNDVTSTLVGTVLVIGKENSSTDKTDIITTSDKTMTILELEHDPIQTDNVLTIF